jgi:hypothetical protein
MIIKRIISLIVLSCIHQVSIAQVGIGTSNPHPSAILDVESSNRGFLIPRMTTVQRNQIQNPTQGLMVYNTDRNAIQFYRENVGSSNTLSGWYDTKCTGDASAAFSSFPTGITLDFSDLENNGQFFPQINGGGAVYTSSTSSNVGVGSIGPIPTNIATGAGTGYLSYDDNNEAGNLTSNPIFEFINEETPNNYNASTFVKRIQNRDGSNGDLMTINLVDYSGDFDLILVAKFDATPNSNNASFFSTGGTGTGLLIGVGSQGESHCSRAYFNMNFDSKSFICGSTSENRVPFDTEFHRFRVKYTDNTSGPTVNAKVEFYIDGELIQTYQNSNINSAQISRLDLFNNRARSSYANSSIAYLGLYSDSLTTANFEALDKYLACKFEIQP